jgi:preprotein translocase subunit SecA
MSNEEDIHSRSLNPILQRLENHFLPADSPEFLRNESSIKPKEEKIINQIREKANQSFEGFVFPCQRPKDDLTSQEQQEKDLETLAFVIKKFKETFGISLFDEQILSLYRAIEAYRNPKENGLILQMATGEGKSSVVIPVLIAFLYAQGERVHIYEVNPYLLKEAVERFSQFAQALGIENEMAELTDYQDREGALNKRIVFGYWPNFIHNFQHRFITGEIDEKEKKPPVLILDEVDPLLNEEAVNPAVISQVEGSEEKIDLKESINQYIERLRQGTSPVEDFSVMINGERFTIQKESIFIPQNADEFFNEIQGFFEVLLHLQQNAAGFPPDEVYTYLIKRLPLQIFSNLLWQSGVDVERLSVKDLEKLYEKTGKFFWWEKPDFIHPLIQAFMMRQGIDYDVEKNNGKIKIIPKSVHTGYQEENKQFEALVNLFLYFKHAKTLDEIPTDIISFDQDRLSILAYYLSQKEAGSKIFGFTGTAETVAKRLKEVYSLSTTLIPEHFPTRRQLKTEFVLDFEAKVKRLKQILGKDYNVRNTLVVVETPEEAERIKKEIMENFPNREVDVLSSENEDQDARLYQWLSQKGENPRVLICVKMVGRGVDLKPEGEVKEKGLLLVSLTPFKYERSYRQLLGRVGRRGEQGEVYVLVSPDDEVFSYLSIDVKRKLKLLFEKKAWQFWEEEITTRMRYLGISVLPVERLRLWLMGEYNLPFFEKKLQEHSLPVKEVKEFIRYHWIELLTFFEETFNAWAAAGSLGPFGKNQPEILWPNFVYEEILKRAFDYIKAQESQ